MQHRPPRKVGKMKRNVAALNASDPLPEPRDALRRVRVVEVARTQGAIMGQHHPLPLRRVLLKRSEGAVGLEPQHRVGVVDVTDDINRFAEK